jgi:hypothetical protein
MCRDGMNRYVINVGTGITWEGERKVERNGGMVSM